MVPSHNQINVAVCNQITTLFLYYISSRLVTLLKVIDAPVQVTDICYHIVSFSLMFVGPCIIVIAEE